MRLWGLWIIELKAIENLLHVSLEDYMGTFADPELFTGIGS